MITRDVAAAAVLSFEIPPPSDQPHVFQRNFLNAIRSAIGKAQIAGDIDAQLAVECFKALPPVKPESQ